MTEQYEEQLMLCGTCQWWRGFGSTGQCHKFPEAVKKDAVDFCSLWTSKVGMVTEEQP